MKNRLPAALIGASTFFLAACGGSSASPGVGTAAVAVVPAGSLSSAAPITPLTISSPASPTVSAATAVPGAPPPVSSSLPTSSPDPTPTPLPSVQPSDRISLGDFTFYTKGSYSAFASPWCSYVSTALIVGKDLIDTITLSPSTFPNNVDISVKAPVQPPSTYGCGVYGYHLVSYGNYDSGIPQTPVTPRQVANIKSFSINFNIDSSTRGGEYNVLNEFYLTSISGNSNSKVLEIGYFLHASASAIAFASTGKDLGHFTDSSGQVWTANLVGSFVTLIPIDRTDVKSGNLDILMLLHYLQSKQVINGSEWVNGIAVGVEPIRGIASAKIANWQVTLG